MQTGKFLSLRKSLAITFVGAVISVLAACGGGGGGGGSSLPQKVKIVYPTSGASITEDNIGTDFALKWLVDGVSASDLTVKLNGTEITGMFTVTSTGATAGTFGMQVLMADGSNTLTAEVAGGQKASVTFDAAGINAPHPIVTGVSGTVQFGNEVSATGVVRQKVALDSVTIVGSDGVTSLGTGTPYTATNLVGFNLSALAVPAGYAAPDLYDMKITATDTRIPARSSEVKLALPVREMSNIFALQLNNSLFDVFTPWVDELVTSAGWLGNLNTWLADTDNVDPAELCGLFEQLGKGTHVDCSIQLNSISFTKSQVTSLQVVDNSADGFGLLVTVNVGTATAGVVIQGYPDGGSTPDELDFDAIFRGYPPNDSAGVNLTILLNLAADTGKIVAVSLPSDAVEMTYGLTVDCGLSDECGLGTDSGTLLSGLQNYPFAIGQLNNGTAVNFVEDGASPLQSDPNLGQLLQQKLNSLTYKGDSLFDMLSIGEVDDITSNNPDQIYYLQDLDADGNPLTGAEAVSESYHVVKAGNVSEAGTSVEGGFLSINGSYSTANIDNGANDEYKQALGSYYLPVSTSSPVAQADLNTSGTADVGIAIARNYLNQWLMEAYRIDSLGLATITDTSKQLTVSDCLLSNNGNLGVLGDQLLAQLNSYNISHTIDACDEVLVDMDMGAVPYIDLLDDGTLQLNLNALNIRVEITGETILSKLPYMDMEIDVKARMHFAVDAATAKPVISIAADDLAVRVVSFEMTSLEIAGETISPYTAETIQPLLLDLIADEVEEVSAAQFETVDQFIDLTGTGIVDLPKRIALNLSGFGVDSSTEYMMLETNVCDYADDCDTNKTSLVDVYVVDCNSSERADAGGFDQLTGVNAADQDTLDQAEVFCEEYHSDL